MTSGYTPRSPDLPSLSGYRPQSPDLSALSGFDNQHPIPHRQLFGDFSERYAPPSNPTSAPYSQHDMPAMRMKEEDDEYMPDAPERKTKLGVPAATKSGASDPTQGIVLKTSFPVARIKRIMQADEDIGKVAQVTPHVVSRALELFMIKLITASCDQARGPVNANNKGPKKVLVQHMKKAIQTEETLDFLVDIIAKVPDAPTRSKKEANSDSEDTKPKKRAKKRKDSTDEV